MLTEFYKKIYTLLLPSLAICIFVSCNSSNDHSSAAELPVMLCDKIAVERYKNLEQMETASLQLDTLAAASYEQRSVARNALAYAALMRMDYSASKEQYSSVIEEAHCEIERLVADVGLMMLCFRTSSNRAFFDYRSSALRRVRRINEEEQQLLPHDKQRFFAAKVELAAVSLCYFVNLGMREETERAANYLEKNIATIENVGQRLYGRLILNYRTELPLLQRAESLLNVLSRSQREGELWLVANSKLLLSLLLRNDESRERVVAAFPSRIRELYADTIDIRWLPYNLAVEAVRDFERYGDIYMSIEATTVAASCATYIGDFNLSISLLNDAMRQINGYYQRYYPDSNLSPLVLYDVDEESERRLMESDTIDNICECMLSVRREASCTYAGIGDKYASDVNRNAYLDLLRSTRLNKQTESRVVAAQQNAARLYVWLVVLLLLVVGVVVVVVFLNIKWTRHNVAYANDLESLLRVCRRLMSSMPAELPDTEAVCTAVCDILNNGLSRFSGNTRFSILSAETANECCNIECSMPLVLMDGSSQWILCVEAQDHLTSVKRSLLEILLPYVAVAIDEGMRIVGIGDECSFLQQKQEAYKIYLASHRRENVLKRVSLSVLNGMTPYINRILNELNHLSASVKDDGRKRLEYIAELIAVLDEHNSVLERWIKTKQGELSLHIESFALSELFAILKNSAQAFLIKGVEFSVKDTEAVVKADKALTLFMINTLADNAGKFTPRGGKVTLEAIEGDDYIEVIVTDTGCGMSNEDIDRILNNKVYDASQIGSDLPSSMNKGSGFGLMNCKGIIEKYRKSDSLFSVCSLNISSKKGSGSRFSFRLPRGIIRMVVILLLTLLPLGARAGATHLERVSELADSVYLCNVEGRHSQALIYAEEAIALLNNFYRGVQPTGEDTLSFASGDAVELGWWRSSLFSDSLTEEVYYNLLDIRNEAAVAALAERRWQLYRYNNSIYTMLYRLVHEDNELVQYYEQMQAVANYRHAAVVVCVALLILLLFISVIMYLHRVVFERMNTRIMLDVNSRLLNVACGGRVTDDLPAEKIAEAIYAGTHEYLRVKSVALLLKDGSSTQIAASPEKIDHHTLILLGGIFENGNSYVSKDGKLRVLPLVAKTTHEEKRMGVLYLEVERVLTKSEAAMLELIASYAASAAYYSIVSLSENYRSLDDVEEDTERLKYEENNIHVRNMVIDNCLSMIKHETIYYPPRIAALVEQLRSSECSVEEWDKGVSAIRELMIYYNQVFDILSKCASRQLDDTSFTVSQISLDAICSRLQRRIANRARRSGVNISFGYTTNNAVVYGDEVLVEQLFDSLFDALLARSSDGELRLSVTPDDRLLRIELLDTRCRLTNDELSSMFVPKQDATSLEYLIVKEIIRMHEDYMDIRGSRVEAYDTVEGVVILFTLPLKK